MKTTAIMIEFLVAGLLVLLALFLLALSFFPTGMQLFLDQINKSRHWLAKAPFLITILISVAYGFGVLFEYPGVIAFEWKHKMITFFNVIAIRHRFNKYCRAIERSFKMLMLEKVEIEKVK